MCELYNSIHDYAAIQRVCGRAMACDELSEDVHYWMIRSWVEMGYADDALKQYETAVEILYEKLGIHRSDRMKELYDEILGMNKNSTEVTMDDIYEEIQEEDPNGVFFLRVYGISGNIQTGSQTGAAVRQCRVYAASDYKDK